MSFYSTANIFELFISLDLDKFTGYILIEIPENSKKKFDTNNFQTANCRLWFIDGFFVGYTNPKFIFLESFFSLTKINDTQRLALRQFQNGKKFAGEFLRSYIKDSDIDSYKAKTLDEAFDLYFQNQKDLLIKDIFSVKRLSYLKTPTDRKIFPKDNILGCGRKTRGIDLFLEVTRKIPDEQYVKYFDNYYLNNEYIISPSDFAINDIYLDPIEKRFYETCVENPDRKLLKIADISKIRLYKARAIATKFKMIGIISARLPQGNLSIESQFKRDKKLDIKKVREKPYVYTFIFFVLFVLSSFIGIFEKLDLSNLDLFFRLRKKIASKDIVVVTIDDTDINKLNTYPISDEILSIALDRILKKDPIAIGLDIYRDVSVSPGKEQLDDLFRKSDKVIGVEKVVFPQTSPNPILSEKGLSSMADLIYDNDGYLRRSLSIISSDEKEYYGLGTSLAFKYIENKGFKVVPDNNNNITFFDTTIPRLTKEYGFYRNQDLGGYQFAIDYVDPNSFKTISFFDVYRDKNIDANDFKDKIVFIGVTADSEKDFVRTPFSSLANNYKPTAGVFIHANITNTFLSYLNEEALVIKPLNIYLEYTLIVFFLLFGMLFSLFLLWYKLFSNIKIIPAFVSISTFIVLGSFLLYGSFYFLFLSTGYIIPVITCLLGFLSSTIISLILFENSSKIIAFVDRKYNCFNSFYLKTFVETSFLENSNFSFIVLSLDSKLDNYEKNAIDLSKILNNHAIDNGILTKHDKYFIFMCSSWSKDYIIRECNSLISHIKQASFSHSYKIGWSSSIKGSNFSELITLANKNAKVIN